MFRRHRLRVGWREQTDDVTPTEADRGAEQAVAFADLAGYTALTEVHGDTGAADVAERFIELTETVLPEGARLVKTIGDAVLVVTADPVAGIRFGLDLLCAVEAEPHFPGVRVGVHYGSVVERRNDVFGATVNVAARLTAHAHVGQLLTTDRIAERLGGERDLATTALGATWLKNVSEPVEIYWVADHTAPASAQVLDPVCQMFVDAERAPAQLPWSDRIWHFCSFECASAFSANPEKYASL
jgi:class 3 adenylate cyclase/YHS domain-containing protein